MKQGIQFYQTARSRNHVLFNLRAMNDLMKDFVKL